MIYKELLELEFSDKFFTSLNNGSNNSVAIEHLHGCLLLPISGTGGFFSCWCMSCHKFDFCNQLLMILKIILKIRSIFKIRSVYILLLVHKAELDCINELAKDLILTTKET